MPHCSSYQKPQSDLHFDPPILILIHPICLRGLILRMIWKVCRKALDDLLTSASEIIWGSVQHHHRQTRQIGAFYKLSITAVKSWEITLIIEPQKRVWEATKFYWCSTTGSNCQSYSQEQLTHLKYSAVLGMQPQSYFILNCWRRHKWINVHDFFSLYCSKYILFQTCHVETK